MEGWLCWWPSTVQRTERKAVWPNSRVVASLAWLEGADRSMEAGIEVRRNQGRLGSSTLSTITPMLLHRKKMESETVDAESDLWRN